MINHTKGDWRINNRPNGKISIVGDSGRQVCLMWNDANRDDNAKLIKSSPRMLMALQGVFELLSFDDKYMHLDEAKEIEELLNELENQND